MILCHSSEDVKLLSLWLSSSSSLLYENAKCYKNVLIGETGLRVDLYIIILYRSPYINVIMLSSLRFTCAIENLPTHSYTRTGARSLVRSSDKRVIGRLNRNVVLYIILCIQVCVCVCSYLIRFTCYNNNYYYWNNRPIAINGLIPITLCAHIIYYTIYNHTHTRGTR